MRAEFYVELEPQFGGFERKHVDGIKAVKVTQNYPRQLTNALSVVAHFTVEVDERLFEPLALEFAAVLPEPDAPHVKLLGAPRG